MIVIIKQNYTPYEDKFDLIIHKHYRTSIIYNLTLVCELMTNKISTGESITPTKTIGGNPIIDQCQ